VIGRRLAEVAAALLLSSATGACLPVPWHRTVFVSPEGTVRVVDAVTRAPIAGAEVVVRRYNIGPPPRRETDRFSATTSSAGEASFLGSARGEWVMPLMMHGVPQWGAEVCASAPGFAPISATWVVQRNWSNPRKDERSIPAIELSLEPASATSTPAASCAQSGNNFFESYPQSVRMTFSGKAPARPAAVPATATYLAANGGDWIDCRSAAAPGAFDCDVFESEHGARMVSGTFEARARHSDVAPLPTLPLSYYSYDFSDDEVLLQGDLTLVAVGWVTYPLIPDRRHFDHGRRIP
jgi:hypothetical protein